MQNLVIIVLLLLILKKRKQSTESNKFNLHPDVYQAYLKAELELKHQGIEIRITSGMRTFKEQNELYQRGSENDQNKVTNARGGESYHNYGLALDIYPKQGGYKTIYWNIIADTFKKEGFEWGGDWSSFKDKPHFQMPLGYSIKELKSNQNIYHYAESEEFTKLFSSF